MDATRKRKHYRKLRLRGDYIDTDGPVRVVFLQHAKGATEVLFISEFGVTQVQMPARIGKRRLQTGRKSVEL